VFSALRPEPRRVKQLLGMELSTEPYIRLSLALCLALVLTENRKNLPKRGIAEL